MNIILLCIAISCAITVSIFFWRYLKRVDSQRLSDSLLSCEISFTPENTVIVFDIHGVLFRPDYLRIIKIFWASPYKYRFMRYALYPSNWIDYIYLNREQVIFERCVAHFLNKYPSLRPSMPLIVTIANTQNPIPETISLIKELSALGYELHILSNIGEPFFEDLKKKFPEMFAYFKFIKTPTAQNSFMGKPNPIIFCEYLKESNQEGKQILFIDDTLENIKVATEFGIKGLFFSDPEQLKNDFIALRVIGG